MCCRSPRCASTTLGITCARFRRRNRGFGTGRRAHTHAAAHTNTTQAHTHVHARMITDTPTHALAHTQLRAARRVTWSTGRAAEQSAAHNARATCTGHTIFSACNVHCPGRYTGRSDQLWAHPSHICAGTGLTPPTSAPGLGSPRPHLRRDPVEYGQVGSAHLFDLSFSQVGRCIQVRACLPRVRLQTMRACVRACVRASTRLRESTV